MLKIIKNKKVWQNFFEQNRGLTFIQSWPWSKFQKNLNNDIIRLGFYNKKKLLAICLIIKIKAKKASFFFIPHGPIFKRELVSNLKQIKKVIKTIRDFLVKKAKKEGFDFIRLAPILENTPENLKIFNDLGFKTAPIYMHAETTWILPLDKNKDELLAQMRKTTRYLIRRGQRDGVIIEKRTDKKAVDDFYKIYLQTAKREHFQPFSYDYIKKEFLAFKKEDQAIFLFAKLKKSIDKYLPANSFFAGALIIFNKNSAFYHQGASIHTKIPATYLLQWKAILEAKKRGCQYYNFWGIYDPQTKRTPKSWQGLTLFKTGFGGQKKQFLPTQDYVVNWPKYLISYLWEKIIFLKRSL